MRALLLVCVLLLAGCAPRFAPLYRDFEAPRDSTQARLARALTASGWTLGNASPAGTLSTAPRSGSEFGLYRMGLSLDALPLGEQHVRLLFHPVRRYAWGSRSVISYLPRGLRRRYEGELVRALKAEGFTPAVSGARKDRETR